MSTTTETKQAWTPGPWRAWPSNTDRPLSVITDNCNICNLLRRANPETPANARLIAKAPEMAEVLTSMLAVLDWWRNEGKPNYAAMLKFIESSERILREAGAL